VHAHFFDCVGNFTLACSQRCRSRDKNNLTRKFKDSERLFSASSSTAPQPESGKDGDDSGHREKRKRKKEREKQRKKMLGGSEKVVPAIGASEDNL
jgi:hypothetical protein